MKTAIKAQLAALTAIKEDVQEQIADLDRVKTEVQNRAISGNELPGDVDTWATANLTQLGLINAESELTMAINALGRI